MRIGWCVAAAVAAMVVGAAAGAAPKNEYNDKLVNLSPGDRAAKLAEVIGSWCVGTSTFLMGISESGPEQGYAYWSLRCLDGRSFAIQIDPQGGGAAVDCETLKEQSGGRDCFKKF